MIGRVVSVTDYGAFVELEPGVEGLIHISEMTWSRRMKHPTKVVKAGDQVEAVVLEVKPRDRRVSLGIKQLEADPWTTVAERYSLGSVVEGRVRKLTDFGAFIEIEEGIDGLVHVSDLVLDQAGEASLRSAEEGPVGAGRDSARSTRPTAGCRWASSSCSRMPGRASSAPIRWAIWCAAGCAAPANFGVFVELAPGVEGLCHRSEIPGTSEHRHDESPLPIGEECDFKIVQDERSREEDRAEPSCAGRRRGTHPAGRLPAPGRRRHNDHRRSDEHPSQG